MRRAISFKKFDGVCGWFCVQTNTMPGFAQVWFNFAEEESLLNHQLDFFFFFFSRLLRHFYPGILPMHHRRWPYHSEPCPLVQPHLHILADHMP